MSMNKGFYTILIIILVVLITGCNSTRVLPSTVPTVIDPTIIEVEPSPPSATLPTDQPTEQPVTPATAMSPSPVPVASQQNLDGAGKELAESVCIVCHSFERVSNSHKSRAEWETTVNRMIDHGAPLDETQQVSVIEYLSATYK